MSEQAHDPVVPGVSVRLLHRQRPAASSGAATRRPGTVPSLSKDWLRLSETRIPCWHGRRRKLSISVSPCATGLSGFVQPNLSGKGRTLPATATFRSRNWRPRRKPRTSAAPGGGTSMPVRPFAVHIRRLCGQRPHKATICPRRRFAKEKCGRCPHFQLLNLRLTRKSFSLESRTAISSNCPTSTTRRSAASTKSKRCAAAGPREPRRQIDSRLYERIELGNDAQPAAAFENSPRTMERWLKQVRKTGGIEFVGPPKTGGYHARAAP